EEDVARLVSKMAEEFGCTEEEIRAENKDKDGIEHLERLATIRLLSEYLEKDAKITEKDISITDPS
ncbi:MAG TPA: hypothetical protein PJ989_04560, partial [Oligoflexia bacterium]|nr:hypothetical protein [Oligoflexia bacterium]